MKAVSLTGKVIHAGYNNGLYVICNPSGTMGARQKRYRKASDTYTVNCKGCLRKLATAEAEAYAEAAGAGEGSSCTGKEVHLSC